MSGTEYLRESEALLRLPVKTIASKVLEVSPNLLTGEGYRPKRDRAIAKTRTAG